MTDDLHPPEPRVPLLITCGPHNNLGDGIRHAVFTARTCQIEVLLEFGGELLCVEPGHTEDQVLEAWSRSRHMARRARGT